MTFFSVIIPLYNKENFIENQLTTILTYLKGKESLFAVFFVFILIFATITESIGLHFIIGAFNRSPSVAEADLATGFLGLNVGGFWGLWQCLFQPGLLCQNARNIVSFK